MARDLALILEGGGSKGSYVYGAMNALDKIFNDQYGLANFTYMAGTSVSALTIMYTLADQFHSDSLDLWSDRFSDKRIMDRLNLTRLLSGPPIFDASYLVDQVLQKQHPLNWRILTKSLCKFYIPLVDVKSLSLKYYTNDTEVSSALLPYELIFMDKNNPAEIYSMMKAAIASPVFFNQEVKIQGRAYVNGALLSPFPLTAPIPSSAKRICILTKPTAKSASWFNDRLLPSLARGGIFQGSLSNSDIYNLHSSEDRNYHAMLSQIDIYEDDILIRPSVNISVSDNSKKNLLKNIDMGFQDTMLLKEDILRLINKS